MDIEKMKGKLDKAYQQLQGMTIKAHRETMTLLLSAMINVQDVYNMLGEGEKDDKPEAEGRDNA